MFIEDNLKDDLLLVILSMTKNEVLAWSTAGVISGDHEEQKYKSSCPKDDIEIAVFFDELNDLYWIQIFCKDNLCIAINSDENQKVESIHYAATGDSLTSVIEAFVKKNQHHIDSEYQLRTSNKDEKTQKEQNLLNEMKLNSTKVYMVRKENEIGLHKLNECIDSVWDSQKGADDRMNTASNCKGLLIMPVNRIPKPSKLFEEGYVGSPYPDICTVNVDIGD